MNEKVATPLVKRVFDIAVSSAIILILSPFILLIFLAMAIECLFAPSSRGPFFYKETRISEGKPFKLLKFRIFRMSALKNNGAFIHTKDLEKDKNNLSYAGRFLKRVYMDELPQLINVLKGDLSLVGPRPTNLVNSQKLLEKGRMSKFLIRGGLTGYYQTHKGNKYRQDQEETDMRYVNFCRTNSGLKIVLYDAKIIFITIWTVFKAEGL
jgi:lipopolysaccharide/colanic/teichoic acid biosynthesis glycosyltransferase